MDVLFDFGLEASRWLQTNLPFLSAFFRFVSLLGIELAYLLFLPLVYWCWNKSYGRHFAYVFLLSTFVNFTFKHAFRGPRPYWLDADVNLMDTSASYGIPSGHVQSATTTVLFFASKLKNKAMWWFAAIYIALMMISRIFVGHHFVQDVFAGFFLGLLVLTGYWIWNSQVHKDFSKRILGFRLMIAILVPIVCVVVYTAVFFLIGSPNENVPWASFLEGAEKESLESITTAISSLLGTGIGLSFEKSRVRFQATGPIWKRIARYVLGIIVAGLIWGGLGQLFPDEPLALAIPLRAIRYTLLTLWVTYYAPLVFVLTRLADADPEPQIDLTIA